MASLHCQLTSDRKLSDSCSHCIVLRTLGVERRNAKTAVPMNGTISIKTRPNNAMHAGSAITLRFQSAITGAEPVMANRSAVGGICCRLQALFVSQVFS